MASLDIILSKKRTTKALISLHGQAGWSTPLLFANPRRQVFSHGGPSKIFDPTFQERLASVYQELGDETLDPVPFKILIEHPLIQDITQACTSYKALVSQSSTSKIYIVVKHYTKLKF